ncbi:MAG: NTP pyrophosphohydrolases including oxidative damage repair enzymes [uncultured Arthrobacter sp.]|uniref:NTP pyrophosphohydrolases including oxidative damage repair enzymes n=1 Tax=uncultured Arthrobacter sp. TaxID=114050 RepID=A0A6J4GX29_9MICC|nr:DUF1810 domain-containing protein [uncultured Arthrobacter sp.]CAA9209094.1 MAG: NTP pyrophosphohydrolases including oxidative damage repair enzymes [uncultured Arthrobacter sp.]
MDTQTAGDPYRLERFVTAQDVGGTYPRALREIRAGRKQSHWMWFVFPQIQGLGSSATAREFAISSLAEAQAYLAHPVLGPRLLECAAAAAALPGQSAEAVFGGIDARKLHSSATLFHRTAPGEPVFSDLLAKYFDLQPDTATDERL